jgi:hypothetical protein
MIARGSGVRSVGPVLALIAFGLLLTSAELLHVHRSGELGLYNTECPLAEVAARHSEASLPSTPLLVATWLTVDRAPVVTSLSVSTLFARSADSRAPPRLI